MSQSTVDDNSEATMSVGFGPCLTAPLTVAGLDEEAVRAALLGAFAEQRAFPFLPRPEWGAAGLQARQRMVAAVRDAAVAGAAPESRCNGRTAASRRASDAPARRCRTPDPRGNHPRRRRHPWGN